MANSETGRLFRGPAPQTVVVNTTNVTGKQISVSFDTPNGNQPDSYGNKLWIWQSGNQVPWSSTGKSQAINVNTQSGDTSFDDLQVTTRSYIIGYAVGDDGDNDWPYPNVVATVFIPALGNASSLDPRQQVGEVFSPKVGVQTYGATSLVVNYHMLAGYNPERSKTYVGVWEGEVVSYTQPPKWYRPVQSTNSRDTVSFNNIKILRGTTYAMGLFASGYADDPSALKQTALAATNGFTV